MCASKCAVVTVWFLSCRGLTVISAHLCDQYDYLKDGAGLT